MPDPVLGEGAGHRATELNRTCLSVLKQLNVGENE